MSRAYAEAKAKKPNAKKDTILKDISPVYGPGRTKQSFKDSTDINKIMDKARKTGVVTHVGKYGSEYGDYSDVPDLMEAHERLQRANEIFEDLPGEVRREFKQSPADFFAWVNDPDNADKLESKLGNIARRGDQLPVVRKQGPVGAASEPVANVSSSEGVESTPDVSASTEA